MTIGGRIHRLINHCRVLRLRFQRAKVGPRCQLASGLQARPGLRDGRHGKIVMGPECWIEEGAILDAFGGSIILGPKVFLGPYVVIYGHGGVNIGDSCLISMHSRILSSNHTIAPVGRDIRLEPDILLPTRIGRDVWLGAGVTVLGGVTIGDGCVVGAGAVVADDLPPYAVAVGAPAKVIRQRA
jgi:acetyltransferase-like isoleucine patch superfamily enzyme